ncbi:MAG: arginase family protein, partial [Planctomycetota bacterium]|nr:arginase family protein [Planctomycetota bacterium]
MPAAERSSASPGAFLGLDSPYSDLARARVVVVPLPYEATVSYAGGTAAGPEAILAASRQVELYDRDFADEPALAYGVHTLPPLSFPPGLPPATVQERVTQAAAAVAKEHFPLALGGEHSLSPGVFAGLCQARPGVMFDIVHLDAHADLRDSYDATPYSHACAARRLLENPACRFLWQLGIRSLASEEAAYIRERPDRIRTWFIEELRSGTTWREELHRGIQGRPVFLTFDVDCLDPAVV